MNLIKYITPINLLQEKQKFFFDDKYNPVFKYFWQSEDAKFVDDGTSKANLIEAIIENNSEKIIFAAKTHFSINDFEYLDKALQITSVKPEPIGEMKPEDFLTGFSEAFKFLGLDEYTIRVVDDHGFNFRPSVNRKEVAFSKHADFQFFDVESEVRHELAHIIRYENGKYNGIKKSSDYILTEEGLATLMADTGINGFAAEFQHAAEYVSSKIGLEGSLRDIFNYLKSIGFNDDLAWQRASRHKFGFIDTGKPGDILKPAIYFSNAEKLKKLSKDEIIRLFVGKISVSELENYSEYKGKITLNKLIEFYKF